MQQKTTLKAISLNIPLDRFGKLATAAALDGMDITRWVKRKIQRAAADGSLARFAAERKAALQAAAADDAAGSPAPVAMPPIPPAPAESAPADTVNPSPTTAADA